MLQPTAIRVKPLTDYCLYIEFDNGEKKVFDVKPYIKGNLYGKLHDAAVFNSVRTNGYTVEWSGGQDIAPHELYDYGKPIE